MKVDPSKVNGSQSKGVANSTAAKRTGKPGEANAKGGGSVLDLADSSSISVSDRARDFNKIREAAVAAPDVDEAKVAKYKSLIKSGQYKVDAEKVADRLVDEHMMMSGLTSEE